MILLRNIGLLITCRPGGGQGNLHAIPGGALVWSSGRIVWAGPEDDVPANLGTLVMEDAGGRMVVPGLVDCHTHLAFGGWRADEFARRARGETYADIARSGGGILSTVRVTRAAGEAALASKADEALTRMMALGVTTIEAKSGYGLTVEHELMLLRIYKELQARGPVRIVPTVLGAHALPPEFSSDRAGYLRLLTEELFPRIAALQLARFCDVFVEEGAFTVDEARQVLQAGRRMGLVPKLHADQLTSSGGAELAAEVGAISADHLEQVSDAGIAAMAGAGVVAVSLPIASLYLRQPPLPARKLLDAGVPVAVATDFNPGSAPSYHLPLAMTLACTTQGMTPSEALKGATIVAARALGEEQEIGSLEEGKAADFAVIDAPSVEHWLYHFRPNACVRTVIGGRTVWRGSE
jgi:imidazolonepropionase